MRLSNLPDDWNVCTWECEECGTVSAVGDEECDCSLNEDQNDTTSHEEAAWEAEQDAREMQFDSSYY